jgi:hypothetical protein
MMIQIYKNVSINDKSTALKQHKVRGWRILSRPVFKGLTLIISAVNSLRVLVWGGLSVGV